MLLINVAINQGYLYSLWEWNIKTVFCFTVNSIQKIMHWKKRIKIIRYALKCNASWNEKHDWIRRQFIFKSKSNTMQGNHNNLISTDISQRKLSYKPGNIPYTSMVIEVRLLPWASHNFTAKLNTSVPTKTFSIHLEYFHSHMIGAMYRSTCI